VCARARIFFVIRIVGGGSTWYVGHQLAYCTGPGWLWWWRNCWNDDWRGKPKYSEKSCPSAALSTTNPTWPDRAWTQAATVRGQRLTAWAMAQLHIVCSAEQLGTARSISECQLQGRHVETVWPAAWNVIKLLLFIWIKQIMYMKWEPDIINLWEISSYIHGNFKEMSFYIYFYTYQL
jgi:hypothetical protein